METTETIIKPTKTFKEVHIELENEALFLQKNHDISGFSAKADFLNASGFGNSIATKLYTSIVKNKDVVRQISERYMGLYKFILEPQLERVCEKYNLYVRDTHVFLGDIPEKNIKDMMNFRLQLEDVPDEALVFLALDLHFSRMSEEEKSSRGYKLPAETEKFLAEIRYNYKALREYMENGGKTKFTISELQSCYQYASNHRVTGYRHDMRFQRVVEIAAIKPLFHESAFRESQSRIISASELEAINQVNLDPIVLCNTKHSGRMIITAWGDEANDELILNQKKN